MENQLYEKELSREYPFRGKIFDVAVCRAELPDGTAVRRDVVCHSGGVCVLPLDENGMVTMVRQYRYGVGTVTLEIPAGKLEVGEDPLEAVMRELSEETGYTADEIIPLHIDYSSPAILSEVIYIYLARGLHGGKQHLDEDEFLETRRYPLSELVEMVMAGEIADGKTQIAILKAARMLEGK
ncbi:MAG: NUDIX hydrolase [Eubacteriales bacterium]